jgi:flagellum-specific peptidoglycan hydrolase FlgJ
LPQKVIDAALASQMRWRVPASVTIAQWVVESAWGAAVPAGSNNPFGIKATADQPSVDGLTREVVNGQFVSTTAKFRAFSSVEEAFDEHGRLLATGAPYRAAMKNAKDANAFADALNGVYATDPNYSFTLKWVIQTYGFERYDQSQ